MINERLIYSNYEVRRNVKSKIDTSQILSVVAGIYCPKCKVILDGELQHAETRTCTCGLKMTRYGNALDCEL